MDANVFKRPDHYSRYLLTEINQCYILCISRRREVKLKSQAVEPVRAIILTATV